MKKIVLGLLAIGMIALTGCEIHLVHSTISLLGRDKEKNNNEINTESFTLGIICDGSLFTWNDVTNPTTGKTWMDRNLGAKQVAISSMMQVLMAISTKWVEELMGMNVDILIQHPC